MGYHAGKPIESVVYCLGILHATTPAFETELPRNSLSFFGDPFFIMCLQIRCETKTKIHSNCPLLMAKKIRGNISPSW